MIESANYMFVPSSVTEDVVIQSKANTSNQTMQNRLHKTPARAMIKLIFLSF